MTGLNYHDAAVRVANRRRGLVQNLNDYAAAQAVARINPRGLSVSENGRFLDGNGNFIGFNLNKDLAPHTSLPPMAYLPMVVQLASHTFEEAPLSILREWTINDPFIKIRIGDLNASVMRSFRALVDSRVRKTNILKPAQIDEWLWLLDHGIMVVPKTTYAISSIDPEWGDEAVERLRPQAVSEWNTIANEVFQPIQSDYYDKNLVAAIQAADDWGRTAAFWGSVQVALEAVRDLPADAAEGAANAAASGLRGVLEGFAANPVSLGLAAVLAVTAGFFAVRARGGRK